MKLLKLFGRKRVTAGPAESVVLGGMRAMRILNGQFDVAQSGHMDTYWSQAKQESADAAMDPAARELIRNRSRYEVANNSYARGIVSTLANDTVGTGPRLQCRTGDRKLDKIIEDAFHAWCDAIDLPEKLRIMRMARAESGEIFGLKVRNERIDHEVKLDLRLLEADLVSSQQSLAQSNLAYGEVDVDGVVYDRLGNVVMYRVLRSHPGATYDLGFSVESDDYPARDVIHYFRASRPDQHRGVPEITPALPLFAQLRRYTLATLGAAETAANFAGILYTDSPANGEADSIEPLDEIELYARSLMTAPAGWKMSQVDAKQPTTTYPDFKRELLNEIARCLSMPFNVAAGNSSSYNYASGRLDHQTYFKSLKVERSHLNRTVLTPLFRAFMEEAVLVSDLLPIAVRRIAQRIPHSWMYDGTEHVDPAKEANAQDTRLKNHSTTYAEEYARQGKDWEVELRQKATEEQFIRELGLAQAGEPAKEEEVEDED